MEAMNTQNALLLERLMEFYHKDNNLEKMIAIINGNTTISLRLVDWFATNYAKKHWTGYETKDGKRFVVYTQYKLQLKAYSKRRFDPFNRWERIDLPYKDGMFVQTTLGQLNFFKWAIENNVIDYITNNLETIELDMAQRNSATRRKPTSSTPGTKRTRKRREELSVSASKGIKKEEIETRVSF